MRIGMKCLLASLLSVALFAACADDGDHIDSTTAESHSWGNYHWGRQSNPFTVDIGDNVSATWDSYLDTAAADWNQSQVLNTNVVAGNATTKRCKPTAGRVEVCAAKYGFNGWLGIAQIWASGDHITQAVVKLNDSYFNTSTYNTTAWRNLVMCQEVGHAWGLDHQDEDFGNDPLGTCMDYSDDPVPNQHPNQHDYQQLEDIYAHTDGTTTVGQTPPDVSEADLSSPGSWGQLMRSRNDGRDEVYVKDFGNGHAVLTHVIWAE